MRQNMSSTHLMFAQIVRMWISTAQCSYTSHVDSRASTIDDFYSSSALVQELARAGAGACAPLSCTSGRCLRTTREARNTCTSPCAGAKASSILLCNFSSKQRHADLHPSDRDASAVCQKTASTAYESATLLRSSGGPTCSCQKNPHATDANLFPRHDARGVALRVDTRAGLGRVG